MNTATKVDHRVARALREDFVRAWHPRGWRFTPLRAAPDSKKPLLDEWTTLPPETVDQALEWAAEGNIGVRMGPVSGNLLAVDVDIAKGATVPSQCDPATFTVETGGGGLHLVYAIPSDVRVGNPTHVWGKDAHVEIRCDGGQIVAPGSIHPETGEVYRVVNDVAPAPIPERLLKEILTYVNRHGSATVTPRDPGKGKAPLDVVERARRYLAKMDPAISGSGGHNATIAAACALARFGLDEGQIRALLDEYNQRCVPPWSERELDHKATEAVKIVGDDTSLRDTPAPSRSAPPRSPAPTTFSDDTPPARAKADGRLVIRVDQVENNLDAACTLAVDALRTDPPQVFQRDRRLVRLGWDGAPTVRGVERAIGAPFVHTLSVAALRGVLAGAVRFERHSRDPRTRQERVSAEMPPLALVQALVDAGAYSLPVLESIVEAPTMRPDGSILSTPGYDAATGLVYHAGPHPFPAVPTHPTADDVKTAAAALAEPFAEFEWARPDEDVAVVVAAALTGLARRAIEGATPPFVVRSPIRGAGKSLVTSCIAAVVTGRRAPVSILARDAEEQRKALFALGLEGHPVVAFDNLVGTVGSPVLSAAVTTGEVRDRILGASKAPAARLCPLWLLNGNGLTFSHDFGRRVLVADFAPTREDPENRTGYRHRDLLGYVLAERPALVSHALTLLRAFHLAGRPGHGRPALGSFEAWDALVRAACLWAGFGDPCACRDRIREEDDDDLRTVRAVALAWRATFGDRRVTVAEAVKAAEHHPALHEALAELSPAEGGKLTARAVGQRMKRLRGRIAGGLKIVGATAGGGAFAYLVSAVGGVGSDKGDRSDSSHPAPMRAHAQARTNPPGEESPLSPLSPPAMADWGEA